MQNGNEDNMDSITFDLLPNELIIKIFLYLDTGSAISGAMFTCQRFYYLIKNDMAFWKKSFQRTFGGVDWYIFKQQQTTIGANADVGSANIDWRNAYIEEFTVARETHSTHERVSSYSFFLSPFFSLLSAGTKVLIPFANELDLNYEGNVFYVGKVLSLVERSGYFRFGSYSITVYRLEKKPTGTHVAEFCTVKLYDSMIFPQHRIQPLLTLLPPRPSTPFVLFAKDQRNDSPPFGHYSGASLFGLGKQMNEKWSKLSPEEREPYNQAGEEDRKWWRRKMKLHELWQILLKDPLD